MNFREAAAHFEQFANDLPALLDDAAEQGLGEVIGRLVPRTPVVKGRMARGYRVMRDGRRVLLVNDEWYAELVIEGTRRSRPNRALQNILNTAERELGAALDRTVTRRFGDWR